MLPGIDNIRLVIRIPRVMTYYSENIDIVRNSVGPWYMKNHRSDAVISASLLVKCAPNKGYVLQKTYFSKRYNNFLGNTGSKQPYAKRPCTFRPFLIPGLTLPSINICQLLF